MLLTGCILTTRNLLRLFPDMMFLRLFFLLAVVTTTPVLPVADAFAAEDEMQVLQMFYDDSDLIVSVTRNAVPLSATAETVTIITSREIEAMNAHTADEVVEKITGVQRELRGGPGNAMSVGIRGSNFNHVRVLLDGLTLNSVSSNYADLSMLPVRVIDRIEVLKGPASSVWGSALGGVINIVTKKPVSGLGGSGYISGGEAGFRDVNGDVSGGDGSFGYYAYAGNLGFDGLRPNAATDLSTIYGKGTWKPGTKSSVEASLLYAGGMRKIGEEGVQDDTEPERLYSHIKWLYDINDDSSVETSVRFVRMGDDFLRKLGPQASTATGSDTSVGGSLVLNYRIENHAAAAGFDYDSGKMAFKARSGGQTLLELRDNIDKWGVFLTDTITLQRFSVTPGLRYDWTSRMATGLTPSLGVTYRITDGTLLRSIAAKGFSLPQITGTGKDRVEKIWSLQAGVESTDVPFVWLRGSFFYSRLSDIQTPEATVSQRFTGFETEVKTVPLFNTSLSAGFMFLNAEDAATGRRVRNVPTHTWNVGVKYDDLTSLQASLLGNYVWWNAEPDFGGKYNDFIWDLNLSKKFSLGRGFTPELFFSLHNIFDGSQYVYTFFKNSGRWAEGGIRFSF